ncbi:hypothetical protein [Candidatus Nanohalobium constans]|uniref:Uncharacterized protein n=1 Tax=Candidatus Nanohalobium constans TaxID=2565781 RepID=A0A5Q0UH01_9ARCH|nr:hypothetical protein [Candidatus Nanohalobium constans]QGA80249.1 hypothetical protein LC1Nh_0348 [Candidatus Nanohalobium constans]
MKGQTQAVTAVLITGVIVGGIASAYVWGVPLIEKRQSQSELQSVESSSEQLLETIRSVSNEGSQSSSEVDFSLNNGRVEVNSEENYIDIITFSDSSNYPKGSWSLLEGSSRQGLSFGAGKYALRGEDSSGVLAVKARKGGNSLIRYRVEFRNLRTDTVSGSELRLVDLQVSGADEASGDVTVELTNKGEEVDSGDDSFTLSSGDELVRRRTVVEVDLR